MSVNDQMVQDIVRQVLANMRISSDASGSRGVFSDMNEAVEAAKKAQAVIGKMPMDHREKIISSIRAKSWKTQRFLHEWV
ncbi:hypothetical protein C823_003286 [Eubacterium plexicaudatum ASF492]|nr:hypothetical protein C823_003286 [Eubacterium plexicaudatum ASF492]